MANKWDLNTAVVELVDSTVGTDLGLAAVAQGKKRFVTYIKVQCRSAANIVELGEASLTSGASALSTTLFSERVNSAYEYPEEPGDVDHPIFAVNAPCFIGANTGVSNVSGTVLTLQYYDE